MLDPDCDIWRAWLQEYALPTDKFQYDVKVGEGMNPDPRMTETIQQWAINITKKRIDVVVHRENEILIVEVTRRAGLRCIAQVVAYPILYCATFNPQKDIKAILVAEHLLLDTEMLLKILQVPYYLLKPLQKDTAKPVTDLSDDTEGKGSAQDDQTS